MGTNKDFDAVEMMRSIRAKLQSKYEKDPELRKKRLSEIRKRHKAKRRHKTFAKS